MYSVYNLMIWIYSLFKYIFLHVVLMIHWTVFSCCFIEGIVIKELNMNSSPYGVLLLRFRDIGIEWKYEART